MGNKGGFFRYADGVDKFLLLFGTLGCIGDGIQTPLTMLVLGSLIDDYARGGSQHTVSIHTINKVTITLVMQIFSFLFCCYILESCDFIVLSVCTQTSCCCHWSCCICFYR